MAIHYGIRDKSKIEKINLPSALEGCLHTQVVSCGEDVIPMGLGNLAWLGILVGHAEKALQKVQEISIEIDSGKRSPYFCEEEFNGVVLNLKD